MNYRKFSLEVNYHKSYQRVEQENLKCSPLDIQDLFHSFNIAQPQILSFSFNVAFAQCAGSFVNVSGDVFNYSDSSTSKTAVSLPLIHH
jgi:hypothetical protein